MEVRAVTKYLDISPQKIRLVCDQVRGLPVEEALQVLQLMPKKGAPLIAKTIRSAIANADENFGLDSDDLYIAKIYADKGPMRRWRRFGARGRFKPLLRRSSHLTVILDERTPSAEEG
jgi:large subunit ribosomal protein L22